MARIITGHFGQIEHARDALEALSRQGFDSGDYACYFLNPPGQHGLFPIGGDTCSDEGRAMPARVPSPAPAPVPVPVPVRHVYCTKGKGSTLTRSTTCPTNPSCPTSRPCATVPAATSRTAP